MSDHVVVSVVVRNAMLAAAGMMFAGGRLDFMTTDGRVIATMPGARFLKSQRGKLRMQVPPEIEAQSSGKVAGLTLVSESGEIFATLGVGLKG